MIEPHGGKLIERILPKGQVKKELNMLSSASRLIVDHDTLLDLENIAEGVYSPLTGFMGREDFKSVTIRKRLKCGLPWTLPVALSVHRRDKGRADINSRILLCNGDNQVAAIMEIKDIYTPDKRKAAKHIFGTVSQSHPGVAKFLSAGDIFLGGDICLIRKNSYPFHDFNFTPSRVRTMINSKKWNTVAGFQTRNIPHRAHEFLQKIGLSLVDGILIHPIIGWKKKGDFNPEVIIRSYQILIEHYYPKDRVIFSGLATAMRYAGPLEAVFHAIIRKNFGCTHFIVGRDHAGVGGFYDKYAAHRIFDKFPDLGIVPLLLNGPYYCKRCMSVVSDKICPHHGRHEVEISGTLIRNMIVRRKRIPEHYLRKEISEYIYRQAKRCFI